MFVYGDVVYAQTWQVLTLKNCIEPLSYASTAYVAASYGSRFFSTVLICKTLGNLQEFFRQMVYRFPWQKIARTPKFLMQFESKPQLCIFVSTYTIFILFLNDSFFLDSVIFYYVQLSCLFTISRICKRIT